MRKFHIELSSSANHLRRGIGEIKAERPDLFVAKGLAVRFEGREDGAPGLEVTREAKGLAVRFGRATDAFRALGRILGGDERDLASGFAETPKFQTLGIMIDVSRNAVLTVDTVKALLRRAALMGLNMCMLYSEDTYQIPGEPFFGYLRGRYSQNELKELDKYAAFFDIEMLPCIEALAHLEQILQWPAYKEYRDTSAVLLAEDERTYALLEKMIRAASAPFRSKRIHIGMDEAMGIGAGRYRQIFGDTDPFIILNRHLARVNDMCKNQGLKTMIWSDMYFRIGSKTHEYYDRDAVIPREVAANIPRDVQLVYWDYYHTDSAFYEEYIERHRSLGGEPMMASGVWTWNHFWADLRFTFKAMTACMKACKAKGLREAIVTLWGDDGNECDVFSALPGIQLFAEYGYADAVDESCLPSRLRGSCECEFDPMVRASDLDNLPWKQGGLSTNVSKWLLYQDPLLSFLDPLLEGLPIANHYSTLATELDRAARKRGSERLRFPAQMARVISIKCDLRGRLAAAQAAGNRKAIKSIVEKDLARLPREVRKLWKLHRDMWLSQYKPFGLEVIEHRYGGLLARLESASERLRAYAGGKGPALPELAVTFEKVFDQKEGLPHFNHSRVKTPSCIK